MHKILLIHPDQKFHSLYKRHLSNYFQVDSAFDGLDGLRMIKNNQPQLIISEYSLPKISGMSLLQFVRSSGSHRHLPFIFFSARQPELESLNQGCSEWLVISEVNPDRLAALCHKHLKLSPKFAQAADFGMQGRPIYV